MHFWANIHLLSLFMFLLGKIWATSPLATQQLQVLKHCHRVTVAMTAMAPSHLYNSKYKVIWTQVISMSGA